MKMTTIPVNYAAAEKISLLSAVTKYRRPMLICDMLDVYMNTPEIKQKMTAYQKKMFQLNKELFEDFSEPKPAGKSKKSA
jgi:hypothetical protein